MNSGVLSQRALLSRHKYWLNLTHPPAFVAQFAAQKNRFDAIQPFISPLPLCDPGAVLCCLFSSLQRDNNHKKNPNYVPAGHCGLSPRRPY